MTPLDRTAFVITAIVHALVALFIVLYHPIAPALDLPQQTLTASWHHEPETIKPAPKKVVQKQPKKLAAATPKAAPSHTPAPASVTESIPVEPQPFETDRKQPNVQTAVTPVYPKRALINNWEGRVRVELRIGTGGQITNIKILQSSGFPELDTAYINSLKQQQYLPQEFRGNAVEGILEQDYTFSLDE